MSGKIQCNGAITIGTGGFIDGEINSEQLYISGKYHGECQAKLIQILSGGLVEGTVYAEQLVIESGGNFYGDSHSFNDKKAELSLVHDAHKSEPSTNKMTNTSKKTS